MSNTLAILGSGAEIDKELKPELFKERRNRISNAIMAILESRGPLRNNSVEILRQGEGLLLKDSIRVASIEITDPNMTTIPQKAQVISEVRQTVSEITKTDITEVSVTVNKGIEDSEVHSNVKPTKRS